MAGLYISGLASGLDTELLIKQLMELESTSVKKLQQRRSTLQIQKDAWHDIYTRLSTLQSKLASLKISSTFQARKAISSDESTFTATADATAATGNYKVRVDKLAQAEIIQSTLLGSILEDTFIGSSNIDLSQTTAYVDYNQGKVTLGASAPYDNSNSKEIVSQNKSISGISYLRFYANASKPTNTNIKYYYSTDNGTTWIEIADPGSTGTEIYVGGATQIKFKAVLSTGDSNVTPELFDYRFVEARKVSGTFKINGREITISNPTSDLTVIRDAINNARAGVTASIVNDKLLLTGDNTGASATIKLEDVSGTLLTDLGLLSGGVNNDLQRAQDAEVWVNGLLVKSATNTVTNAIPGVTLTLHKATGIDENLTITNDTAPAVNAIQDFVNQYNSVMDFISTKIGKGGDLQGDPTLARIQQTLWKMVTETVEGTSGKYRTLWDIGISTGSVVGSGALTFDRSGKLALDTTKLTAALEDDPDAVRALFENGADKGIAEKLDSYIKGLVRSGDGVLTTKEKFLEDVMDDIEEQIARLEERLAAKEEQLRKQFAAMEKALSMLQSQGAWLNAQIMGLYAYSPMARK